MGVENLDKEGRKDRKVCVGKQVTTVRNLGLVFCRSLENLGVTHLRIIPLRGDKAARGLSTYSCHSSWRMVSRTLTLGNIQPSPTMAHIPWARKQLRQKDVGKFIPGGGWLQVASYMVGSRDCV